MSQIIAETETSAEGGSSYKRSLGIFDLMVLGVGGIIGAGIFVQTGVAAKENSGPAVTISYIIAGIVSSFVALCYAELAAMIPSSGSAYTCNDSFFNG